MVEIRRRFHEELRAVEGEVQQTGAKARLLLERRPWGLFPAATWSAARR
jgi:hypothetical protein